MFGQFSRRLVLPVFVLSHPLQGSLIQTRNVASLRDIRVRMKTVQTIKKITSSMKSVAASKLKAAEKAKDRVQPFLNATVGLLANIPPPPAQENIKQIICPLTSDRGLCGSANSSIVRLLNARLKNVTPSTLEFYCIGDKGRSGLARTFKNEIKLGATNLDKKTVSFGELCPIVEKIVTSPDVDKITIVSNRFINPIVFETFVREFPSKKILLNNIGESFKGYEIEGDEKQIVGDLYDYFMTAVIYASLIENVACELSARMSSMDNATRNASEMAIKLNLDFNRKRQAGITKELTEIVSGAAAVEQGIEW